MTKTTFVIPAIVGIAAVLVFGAFSPQVQASGPPTCYGNEATITANHITGAFVGTDGNDVIIGTPGNDRIFAGDGNDKICAHGGDDIIVAGDGNDLVSPGSGADNVRTGDGNDFVENQNDTKTDKINCGDGIDTVFISGEDNIKSNCENFGPP